MLSIAIYSDNIQTTEKLKSIIQDFLIETHIMAKISYLNSPESFLTIPSSYDIYIMDMDSKTDVLDLGQKMREIDRGAKYIYFSSDTSVAHLAAKARADYFLMKPIDSKEVIQVLKEIRQNIKCDSIIIKIAGGERRIRANQLNYINIVKRCLCYHLTDGNMFDGQTLRSSFEKAIYPLQNHQGFLFISPSTLINIGEIKIIKSDHVIFENDDVLYFPKTQYEKVYNAWKNFNRILN